MDTRDSMNILLFFSFVVFLLAQCNATPIDEEPHSGTALVSEASSMSSRSPITLALRLEHPTSWYSYYTNPGLMGKSLEVDWKLPPGFQIKRVGWPTPAYKESFGFRAIGYRGTVYHLFSLIPPETISEKFVTIQADANWQICSDSSCLNEMKHLTLELPVSEESSNDPLAESEFSKARKQYPENGLLGVTAQTTRDTITVQLVGDLARVKVFDEDGQIDAQSDPVISTGSGFTKATFQRNKGNDFAEPGPIKERLSGILQTELGSYQIDIPLNQSSVLSMPEKPSPTFFKAAAIMGGMFFGGLILNLMPCVFPVIGIKIMSFVEQAGNDRRKIILHGVIFTAGVLASFWFLCTIMILGGIKNWGGQLENPYVMLGLIIVMLLLAMNMFGIFEIGVSATGVGSELTQKDGFSGTFFSGGLATIVATPCSAPFLGSALGAAVALPTLLFYLAFTVMALGLSLPYLILSIFPKLIKILPRPGAWMESFKQGMSFLLFATVGYLLWVYSHQVADQSDGQKFLWVILGLIMISCAAWVWGRWNAPSKKKQTQWVARIITAGFLFVGISLAKPSELVPGQAGDADGLWQTWSKEKERDLIEKGHPVFVDFTAKWCLTCQVNKKNTYTSETLAFLKEKGVILLKADKTSANAAIDAELKALKRTAIPVNVLYTPSDSKTAHITSEVLTSTGLQNFVKKHLP